MVLEEDNFVKVLSGRYTDRKKTYKKANNSNSSKDTEQSKNNSFEEKYINCCEILGVDVDCEETELKKVYAIIKNYITRIKIKIKIHKKIY